VRTKSEKKRRSEKRKRRITVGGGSRRSSPERRQSTEGKRPGRAEKNHKVPERLWVSLPLAPEQREGREIGKKKIKREILLLPGPHRGTGGCRPHIVAQRKKERVETGGEGKRKKGEDALGGHFWLRPRP